MHIVGFKRVGKKAASAWEKILCTRRVHTSQLMRQERTRGMSLVKSLLFKQQRPSSTVYYLYPVRKQHGRHTLCLEYQHFFLLRLRGLKLAR